MYTLQGDIYHSVQWWVFLAISADNVHKQAGCNSNFNLARPNTYALALLHPSEYAADPANSSYSLKLCIQRKESARFPRAHVHPATENENGGGGQNAQVPQNSFSNCSAVASSAGVHLALTHASISAWNFALAHMHLTSSLPQRSALVSIAILFRDRQLERIEGREGGKSELTCCSRPRSRREGRRRRNGWGRLDER